MSIAGSVASFFGDNLSALLFFAVVFLLTYYYFLLTKYRLPPGPIGIPWFGFALRNAGNINDIQSWRRTYGNLMSVRFNTRQAIVVSDLKHIKDVFGKHGNYASDRIKDGIIQQYFDYKAGIIFNNGAAWKEQRRFALRSMRDFGMGKLSMEGRIQGEAEQFVIELKKQSGQKLDLQYLITKAVSNVICAIVFGHRFDYGDPAFLKSINKINEVMLSAHLANLAIAVPILRHIPSKIRSEYYQCYQSLDAVVSWIKPQLDEHREKFDHNNVHDFIDAYLAAARNLANNEDCNTSLTDRNMIAVIFDLFLAGTETTSTTLRWALLKMAMYPDIQRRVQDEIDSVVPKGGLPSLQDRSKLVYTEAVMFEVLRWAAISPFGGLHVVSETFDYQGYTFPKESLLLCNIWGVHRNPEVWNEPNRFNPERFLDTTGKINKNLTEHVIPFGVGRRICLGEGLARMEFYLFFSAIMQNFNFDLPTDLQLPDFDTYTPTGLFRPPDGYKLMVTSRTN